MKSFEPEISIKEEIVERQLRAWNARNLAARERGIPAPRLPYRFLTLIRDEGSRGDEIAQRLSQNLGWQVFDKQILNYVAQNAHVRESLVQQLDERSQTLLQDMIARFLRLAENQSFGFSEYHEALLKTLAYLAVHGEAIIVGRGANFALADDKQGLHIRIMASLKVRVRRLEKKWRLPAEQIYRQLQDWDDERKKFIRQDYKQEIDDFSFYSAIFNTDYVSVNKAVDSIMAIMSSPPSTLL